MYVFVLFGGGEKGGTSRSCRGTLLSGHKVQAYKS